MRKTKKNKKIFTKNKKIALIMQRMLENISRYPTFVYLLWEKCSKQPNWTAASRYIVRCTFSPIIRARTSKKGAAVKAFSSRPTFAIIRQLMYTRANQCASRCYQIHICKTASILSDVWVSVTCSERNCFQDAAAWLKGNESKLNKSTKLKREGVYLCVFTASDWDDLNTRSEKR